MIVHEFLDEKMFRSRQKSKFHLEFIKSFDWNRTYKYKSMAEYVLSIFVVIKSGYFISRVSAILWLEQLCCVP